MTARARMSGMDTDSLRSQLLEERAKIDRILAVLDGGRPKSGKRTLSPEARERIAAAQRKRWAQTKKAKKP